MNLDLNLDQAYRALPKTTADIEILLDLLSLKFAGRIRPYSEPALPHFGFLMLLQEPSKDRNLTLLSQ